MRLSFVQSTPSFSDLAPGGTWKAFMRHASRTPEGRLALAAVREARRLVSYTEGKRSGARRDPGVAIGDSRVLVFTSHNQSAYAIAREHLIMPITCHIGRREREEVLQRFRIGELRALVSARVLNEGVDIPDADVAIVLSRIDGRARARPASRPRAPSGGWEARHHLRTGRVGHHRRPRNRGEGERRLHLAETAYPHP